MSKELRRNVERWREMDPKVVAAGSEAQCKYCIDDARSDILFLAELNIDLLAALRELYAQVRGECSWMLDDTRGGQDGLATRCESAIARATGAL